MIPSPDEFIKLIKTLHETDPPFKLGKIDPAYTSGRPKIVFDGESSASTKQYPYMASYAPVANDRVLLAMVSGSYVVIGKIV